MRRVRILLLFLLFFLNLYPESVYDLKDISKDHWAYRAIENLSEKGIFVFDDEFFEGEKSINRFELAYFLSKALDKVENEKANRDDLLILEYIVYEFSEELSKFGFDSKNYMDRLLVLEKDLDQTKINNEKNKEAITDINNRLKELEKSKSARNSGFLDGVSRYNDTFKYLEDFNLYLKSSANYLPGSSANGSDNYRGFYTLGLAFKQENFELMLESETSDDERKQGELVLKGQIESNIYKDYYLTFHTTDYERYLRSYFGNVVYDNHNSFKYEDGREYQYDYFDSYGVSFRNERLGIYIEKTRADYDNVYSLSTTEGITVDNDYTDTFNFIFQADFDYFKGMVLKNGNNNNRDVELVGFYPINNFELSAGIAQKNGNNRSVTGISKEDLGNDIEGIYKYDKLSILNGQVSYIGKTQIDIGIEIKSEDVIIYNNYYGSINYKLTDSGNIKYKFEHIDSFDKPYQNHYVLINIKGEKLSTYGGYNKIDADKKYLVSEESTATPYEKASNYEETILKVEYKFNEKVKAKFGYLLRDYPQDDQKQISFMQVSYNFSNSMRGYIKYIENNGIDFSDRELDINDNMIDLDFNSKTGVIREAEEGRLELGLEIEF